MESRDRATLLPIIDRCIKPESEVHTDDFSSYGNLEELLPNKVALHRVVNHSLNFVDPVTGAHTQNIESKWNQLKMKIKERRGVSDSDDLHYYLQENIWREWNGVSGEDLLVNFFKCISLIFPNVPA